MKTMLLLLVSVVLLTAGLISGAAQKKTPPIKPLDLNTASAEELQQLPGIGPTLSKAIVHLREKSGPFRRVEDLLAVPHITRKTIEKIRPYVTIAAKK